MTKLACEMIGERLSAYRDGVLSPDAAHDVAAHLRECSVCRARLDDIEAVARLVAGAALPAPPGFDERLRARLRAQGFAEQAWARRGRMARRASLLAAGFLVALAVGLGPAIVRGHRSGPPPLSDEQNLNLVLFGATDVEGAANPSPEGLSRRRNRSE